MSDDERAALVGRLDEYGKDDEYVWSSAWDKAQVQPEIVAAARLIEQQAKRLTTADAAPHERQCLASDWNDWNEDRTCTCWKADYDAAKEAGL